MASGNTIKIKVLARNNVVAKNQQPQLQAVSVNYDIAIFVPGTVPTANEVLSRLTVARAVTFANNFAGSVGSVAVAPLSNYVMILQRDGVPIGTVSVAANGNFSFANSVVSDLAVGDSLVVVAPTSIDLNIADISITLLGTRSGN